MFAYALGGVVAGEAVETIDSGGDGDSASWVALRGYGSVD